MNQNINYRWWLFGFAVIGLVYLLSPILTPFLIAAVLAYIANPLVNRLDAIKCGRFSINRTFATMLVMLLMAVVLLLLLIIVVPLFQKEIFLLIQKLPAYFSSAKTRIEPWLMQYFAISLDINIAEIQQALTQHWKAAGNVAKQIAISLSNHGLTIVGWFATLLLVPIVLFYLLLDWDKLIASIYDLLPKRILAKTQEITSEIDNVLAEFLRGQLTVMLLMSAFYAAGLWLAGLELALPIGLLSGLLGFIPYVGIGMGFVLAVVSSLLEHGGLAHLLPILVVFGIGQLLESMLLTPWLVGDRIGLHPLAVIFALMAGGQLFGFTGILLALPVSAAIAVGFKHAKASYLSSDFYKR